jgi:hyperosmotically inducible periplasmic protein
MMVRSLRSIMAFWVLLGFLAGCQAMTGRTTGENIDDTTLTTSVKTSLAKDKAGSLTRVDVDTVKGVVTLTGVVPTTADKARAVEVARGVNGVQKVVDNLQVQKK